jgi:hypothetical protein
MSVDFNTVRARIEDSLHLTTDILDDHFGSMEDIRASYSDREEVDYLIDLKTKSYEIILKKLIDLNLGEIEELIQ